MNQGVADQQVVDLDFKAWQAKQEKVLSGPAFTPPSKMEVDPVLAKQTGGIGMFLIPADPGCHTFAIMARGLFEASPQLYAYSADRIHSSLVTVGKDGFSREKDDPGQEEAVSILCECAEAIALHGSIAINYSRRLVNKTTAIVAGDQVYGYEKAITIANRHVPLISGAKLSWGSHITLARACGAISEEETFRIVALSQQPLNVHIEFFSVVVGHYTSSLEDGFRLVVEHSFPL